VPEPQDAVRRTEEGPTRSEIERRIIELLADGKPIWYVAAVLNMSSHEVHEIGCRAGYPDRAKLRNAI
jgi:hypothetical protein